MSMYGDSEKDEIFYYIERFLEYHSVAELINIVADAVGRVENG